MRVQMPREAIIMEHYKKIKTLQEVIEALEVPVRMQPLLLNAYECISMDMQSQMQFGHMVNTCDFIGACAYQDHSNLFGSREKVRPECRYGKVRTIVDDYIDAQEEMR